MTDTEIWMVFIGASAIAAPIAYHCGWLLDRWIHRRRVR